MNQRLITYQVNPELFLHRITPQFDKATTVGSKRIPVNHIIVLDCSGSMAGDLPAIRQQLKNKLPSLVQEGDTITIIWFSAKGQFGVLKEEVEVRSLTDLSDLNNAIDRFLRPIGLTGFKEPLEETLRVIQRITKNRKDTAFSLFFLTDGHDNQWSDPQNLAAVKALQPVLSSAVFVEYGWYCNKPLLTKMAEACGGSLIFSDGFSSYAPVLERWYD
jgi:Mg-chelatase subunit ChlD